LLADTCGQPPPITKCAHAFLQLSLFALLLLPLLLLLLLCVRPPNALPAGLPLSCLDGLSDLPLLLLLLLLSRLHYAFHNCH